jgi:hypothetical protein
MTGKHPSALAHELHTLEQNLYTLHHELRLIAELANAGGQSAAADGIRLESLGIVLANQAARVKAAQEQAEALYLAQINGGRHEHE